MQSENSMTHSKQVRLNDDDITVVSPIPEGSAGSRISAQNLGLSKTEAENQNQNCGDVASMSCADLNLADPFNAYCLTPTDWTIHSTGGANPKRKYTKYYVRAVVRLENTRTKQY